MAPLTLLVGPNSSGKSSISDALLLVAQSRFRTLPDDEQSPKWGGNLVDLGSFADVVYNHKADRDIEIGVEVRAGFLGKGMLKEENCRANIHFILRAGKNDKVGRLASICFTDYLSGQELDLRYVPGALRVRFAGHATDISHHELRNLQLRGSYRHWRSERRFFERYVFRPLRKIPKRVRGSDAAWERLGLSLDFFLWPIFNEVERVSSGRAPARRWYSLLEAQTDARRSRASDVYDEVDPTMLTSSVDPRFTPYYEGLRFETRSRQMTGLPISLPGALEELDIAEDISSTTVSPYHLSIDVKDNRTGIRSNLLDVGYGASQVIPVLRGCMSRARGPLIVEQPEIHLHPRAQSIVAGYLAKRSQHRQTIVETHSVHVVNQARLLVAAGVLPAEDVIVLFVGRSKAGSVVHPIRINAQGDFSAEWPTGYGFFEERYRDTLELLRLKGKPPRESE